MKQKLLALMLALALVLTMLPTAFAAEPEAPVTTEQVVTTTEDTTQSAAEPETPEDEAEQTNLTGSENEIMLTAEGDGETGSYGGIAVGTPSISNKVATITVTYPENAKNMMAGISYSYGSGASAKTGRAVATVVDENGNCTTYTCAVDEGTSSITTTVDGCTTWVVSDNTLTISGIGAMANYTKSTTKDSNATTAPWANSNVTSVVIENGVTMVGQYSFYNMTSVTSVSFPQSLKEILAYSFEGTSLASVTFPETLEAIRGYAFRNIETLTSVSIPDSVSTLGNRAFQNDTALASVTIGKGISRIDQYTFSGCSKLTSITIPSNVTELVKYAFEKTGLTSVEIPNSITAIPEGAFNACKSLASVTMADSVKTIGKKAFDSCEALKSVTWSNNLTEIGELSFNASGLATVALPDSVTTIGKQAFNNCKSLTSINLGTGLTTIGESAFQGNVLTSVKIPANVTSIGANAFNGKIKDETSFSLASVDASLAGALTTIGNNAFYNLGTGAIIYVNDASVQEKFSLSINASSTNIAVTNGGTFAADTSFTAGTLASPTKEGSVLEGWYGNSDFTGDKVTTTTGDINKVYYAKWNSTITFDPNGGTGTMAAQTIGATDTTTALTQNSFTKTGYTFDKWNTKADGSGTDYVAGATGVGANGSVKLYAQWKPNTYTISFNGGSDVSGSTTSVTATYDQPATLTKNGFTKSGSNFAGWSKTTNGTTVDFSDGAQVENLTVDANGTVTLYAVWTTKTVLNPTLTAQETTYNGKEQAFTLDGYTIAYQQNGTTVTAPKNAGTYDVVISAAETDTTAAYHNTVYGGLVIKKAPLTVKPNNKTAYVGSAKPVLGADDYTVQGLVEGDSLTTKPTLSYKSEPNMNQAGDYEINASDAVADNYNITYQPGFLTVRNYSGGSSGGNSGNTGTQTTTNPDGSKTTTVTDKKTGTVTETTKNKDGSTLVVETKKDGTVTTTDTAKNGVKAVTTDKPGEAVTAKVTIPKSVGTATVSVPAKVTPGTVAVDAKTGKVVKLSVPTEDGLTVKLDGSADLILIDRSKDFTDTADHWAEDAIDFATAHEMFGGTSETTFTPNAPMTRAMLMTVLARFDGHDTEGGANWYDKGMEWAKANGVSDGSNPNGSISREQLAVMLYRYAGSPAVDGGIDRFSDAGKVSGYATDALRWAVSAGIISGMGDGTLAPQGNATRAQVATMLMRFVGDIIK